MNDVFSAYLPISKFEEQPDGTIMAWGRATQEVIDSSNEIMDYASSAPIFKQRSQENSLRSGGHNLMPLRSMHKDIAAGRVTQFDFQDAEKAIDIGMHVVDPIEVSKVKNHVYTGLSIGGKYLRRWPDGGSMRFTADPREISLVDSPSVPTAKLTLFKLDDTEVEDLEKMTGNLPSEGKAIWERVYEENKDKGEESAARIAWTAVKKAGWKKVEEEWEMSKGEPEGHPFRGNQYTTGQGGTTRAQRQELFGVEDQDGTRVKLKDKKTGKEEEVSVREARGELFQVEAQDEESPYTFEPVDKPKEGPSAADRIREFYLTDDGEINFEGAAELLDFGYTQEEIDSALEEVDAELLEESGEAGVEKIEQPEWLGDFKKSVAQAKQLQKDQQDQEAVLLLKLKTTGENVGIAYREGSSLNAPKNYPDNSFEYGDPANWQFPVDLLHKKESVDRFNEGEGNYSAKERHTLGRRITFLASRFGKFMYDPTLMKIKEEMMTQNLNKLDAGAIVTALKAAGAQSASIASTDPQAALAMILGAIDSLGTGSPISGKTVPVQDPSLALGKAFPMDAEEPEEAPKKKLNFEPKGKPVVKPVDLEEETEPAEEVEEPSEAEEAYKILEDKVDSLNNSVSQLMGVLTKRAETPALAESPVGALNSLVSQKNLGLNLNDQEAEIIKALEEGGPYALLKALKAAGADDEIGGALAFQTLNNTIRKATYENLERTGVITASRYTGRLFQ